MTPRNIAVVGSGYVGTVAAACLASLGHSVISVESEPTRLASLVAGKVPFYEPGLDELVRSGMEAGRLVFTSDTSMAVASTDLVFVCVGTPATADGTPDLTAVEVVARDVARSLTRYQIIVNKSTVPIGTGRWLATTMEDYVGPEMFSIVSNPEFLREGSAVHDFFHPDRIVLGADDEAALDVLAEVYAPILEQNFDTGEPGRARPALVRTTLVNAEMAKYAANAFLATKISFANEVARLCEYVGADVTTVTLAMGLDPRIGAQFLDAGIGWGGSCFTKDLSTLIATARNYNYHPSLLEAALLINENQRQLVVDSLLRHLKTLRGARIAVLGLAYKAGTDDLRDSPAVDICNRLINLGAVVHSYDPMVRAVPGSPAIRIAADPIAAASSADAVVVATDWPEFLGIDLRGLRRTMRGSVFLDGRNDFDPGQVLEAGLQYVGIGRSTQLPIEAPALDGTPSRSERRARQAGASADNTSEAETA